MTKIPVRFLAAILGYFVTIASGIGLAKAVEPEEKGDSTVFKDDVIKKNEVTWTVASDLSAHASVAAIGVSKVTPLKSGLSIVYVNNGYNASDYGPLNQLYLVYHSDAENPHYEAVFFLGNIHSVRAINMRDESLLEMEIVYHARIGVSHNAKLLVDLSELNQVMEAPPKKEGGLDVSVTITAFEAR